MKDTIKQPDNKLSKQKYQDLSSFKSIFLNSTSNIAENTAIQFPITGKSLDKNRKENNNNNIKFRSIQLDSIVEQNKNDQKNKAKVCRIKYADSFDDKQIFVDQPGFKKTSIIKTPKNRYYVNKNQSANISKKNTHNYKLGKNINTLIPRPYIDNTKKQLKINFQTIYGAIESAFPKNKFFPKLYDQDKSHTDRKRTKVIHDTISPIDQNNNKNSKFQNQDYLKISNNNLLYNLRQFQHIQRLKMSIQNRKIEQRHRNLSNSSHTQFSLYLFPKSRNQDLNQNQQKKTYSFLKKTSNNISPLHHYHHRNSRKASEHKKQFKKNSSKQQTQRYSPWQKQKTENSVLAAAELT